MLLLGSSFHLASQGEGSGAALAAWGRVAHGRFDGEAAADAGRVRIDGDVLTGTLGADADFGRMLAGVAISLSEGDGSFDHPGVDSGTVESTVTTVSPYLRLKLTEAGLGLGWGTGDMTIVQNAREATGTRPARERMVTKTDLSMRLGTLGARGALLEPGEGGRGVSFSLSPTLGATSSAAERLWGAHDARGLAPDGEFEASRGLTAEAGYGLALFGDRFTGTPNLGFGLSDGGARDWCVGWRLTSAVPGDPGFEVNLDAVRREAANDADAEYGVMLRSLIRW